MVSGNIDKEKHVFCYGQSLWNHAITKQSTGGGYYSQTEVDVNRAGLVPIGVLIDYWSETGGGFTPYITTNGMLGFISPVSITASIGVKIIYREA